MASGTLLVLPAMFIIASCHTAAFRGSPAGNDASLPVARTVGRPVVECRIDWVTPPSYPWQLPQIRPLSGGQVFVVDAYRQQIFLLDRGCGSRIVVDSTSRPPFPPGAELIAAPGDTTWLLDSPARAFLVLDRAGRIVRRVRLEDWRILSQLATRWSNPVVDINGRLVYATIRNDGRFPEIPRDDSLDIRRLTFPGRTAALLATIRNGVGDIERDGPSVKLSLSIVGEGDAWTVTSTGSIVVIRGDGSMSWYDSDSVRTRGLGLPQRLFSESEEQRLRRVADSLLGRNFGASRSGDNPPITLGSLTVLSPVGPDRAPLFVPQSAIADMRGRVWLRLGVRQLFRNPQPPEYAVIDASGRIVDRIRFPEGEAPAGFTRNELFTVHFADGAYWIKSYEY